MPRRDTSRRTPRLRPRLAASAFAVLTAVCGGCDTGPEQYPTAPAGGTVACGGRPLEAGRVVFVPIAAPGEVNAGKQARAYVGEGGEFALSTYADGDGAVVGEHRAFVETADGGNLPACSGSVAETFTVTAGGPNRFSIELSPRSPGQVAGGDEDDEDDD